jgi:hypothetical protein
MEEKAFLGLVLGHVLVLFRTIKSQLSVSSLFIFMREVESCKVRDNSPHHFAQIYTHYFCGTK